MIRFMLEEALHEIGARSPVEQGENRGVLSVKKNVGQTDGRRFDF